MTEQDLLRLESKQDLLRLESKVDNLTDAITQLVRVEERQITHASRLDMLEAELKASKEALVAVDRKVDSWVNRGVGMWAVVMVAWAIYSAVLKDK